MNCPSCMEMHKQLDQRNEATKVWIQSDTQARAYANQVAAQIAQLTEERNLARIEVDVLERRREELEAQVEDLNTHIKGFLE